ncbi:hypothetical protein D9613_001570 [Agrocybe pediades]|uniref:Uncharacterized protein n=1 Tax=Agrocybe pediades TaxID=84607 RepID=A0A8H4R4J1_9AGAR|nr:hypothetical protein D9613_001570 [Agrocybe pediades]
MRLNPFLPIRSQESAVNANAAASQLSEAEIAETTAPATASSKKKKVKQPLPSSSTTATAASQADHQPRPVSELREIVKKMNPEGKKSKAKDAGSLFKALDDYVVLAGVYNATNGQVLDDTYIAATRRAIEAIAMSIDRTIKKGLNVEHLQSLGASLACIVQDAVPVGLSTGTHCLFDTLLNSILVPVVRSFFMLGHKNLEYLLDNGNPRSTRKSSQDCLDARPAVFCLFQQTVMAMVPQSKLQQVETRIDDRSTRLDVTLTLSTLVVETLHHLRQILDERTVQLHESPPDDRPSRVKRLIVQDTLWYLCSVLHTLATVLRGGLLYSTTKKCSTLLPGSEGTKIGRLALLKKTIINLLVALLACKNDREKFLKQEACMPMEDEDSRPKAKDSMGNSGTPDMPRAAQDMDQSQRSPYASYAGDVNGTTSPGNNGGRPIGENTSYTNAPQGQTTPDDAITRNVQLDQTERRMLLRVAESYFEIC